MLGNNSYANEELRLDLFLSHLDVFDEFPEIGLSRRAIASPARTVERKRLSLTRSLKNARTFVRHHMRSLFHDVWTKE
jgi:hypothetical protein